MWFIVLFLRKEPKAWGVAIRPIPLTLHKCGMLRLLQIAEIWNLIRFTHSLDKFLRDFRKKYFNLLKPLKYFLLSADSAIVIRVTEPTAAGGG